MSIIVDVRGAKPPKKEEEQTMKIYAVKVNTVDAYMGYRNGNKVLGYTLTAEKAEELKALKVAELLATNGWWMTIAKNANGEPDTYVEELGEIWEG